MFEYRKADRLANAHSTATSKSRVSPAAPSSTLTSSEESQNDGLSYIRVLKTKLARSASRVLAGPDPTSNSSNATSIPRPRTEVEIRAEEQLADEKDRLAVAEEFQRYILEGVLDDEDLESFSLTQYWGVS